MYIVSGAVVAKELLELYRENPAISFSQLFSGFKGNCIQKH
jgi:hypothetical protein